MKAPLSTFNPSLGGRTPIQETPLPPAFGGMTDTALPAKQFSKA